MSAPRAPHREADAEPPSCTVVIPCYNEHGAIVETVRQVDAILAGRDDAEIIVVDDGSSDGSDRLLDALDQSGEIARLTVVHHRRNRGYGAALKTGMRHAHGAVIVITDADGTYPNERILDLLEGMTAADMVVGSRRGENVTYSMLRRIPKIFLTAFAQWVVRDEIPDLNSGLRAFRREVAERFLGILPDTFSFTTTITLAMMRNRYRVRFVPIDYAERVGSSKIKPIRDTLRFFQLILRTGMYFAPLRILAPVAVAMWLGFFAKAGFDVFVLHDMTESALILLLFAMNTVMFALLADMIDKRCN